MAKKLTRKIYENWLNDLSPTQGSDEWIIGGKIRLYYMLRDQFGSALRKYDKMRFEVGFQDFQRGQNMNLLK